MPVYEYTPLQVKQAVTGYGQALKPQVMEMTRRPAVPATEVPKPDDTADALGYGHLPRAGSGVVAAAGAAGAADQEIDGVAYVL